MNFLDQPVLFIATANAQDARHFYETVLDLHCVSDDPFALVFNVGGTALRIQKVEAVPVVSHTVLGWEVADIDNCVDELTLKGVQFAEIPQLAQDEKAIWRAPSGARVAWFNDPDGNTLSLTQI